MKKDILEETKNLIIEEKQALFEMARIGFTDGGFEIYVNTDDGGNIPHFHYRKGKYPNFTNHTCIRLDKAEYFHHDGKEEVLSSKQRKDLIKFLNKYDKYDKDKTNWEITIKEWNRNNSDIELPLDTPMPDYNNIK